jgi:hypothetical protein
MRKLAYMPVTGRTVNAQSIFIKIRRDEQRIIDIILRRQDLAS